MEKYLLSFTAANLVIPQSIIVAQTFRDTGDWGSAKTRVLKGNLLQSRTNSALIRTSREIINRLKTLHEAQIHLLCDGNHEEQIQMLWLAVCKRYAFIREFAIEVIGDKFARGDRAVTDIDYFSFFNRKAEWHPELDAVSGSTRNKLRTTLLFMLHQAKIIDEQSEIMPTFFSTQAREALDLDAPLSYQIFPAQQSQPPEIR